MSVDEEDDTFDPEAPVELAIDGELDLHAFHPRDVGPLLEEYLPLCQAKGILEVRIIHGKGTGTLRRRVQGLLGKMPLVESYRSADETAGGWGATWVKLRPRPAER